MNTETSQSEASASKPFQAEIAVPKGSKNGNKRQMTAKAVNVAAKTVLGAGTGLLVGVGATIAIIQGLEIVIPALLITKAASVVGGAAGLIKGLSDVNRTRV